MLKYLSMSDGITVRILGDSGSFSKLGKSIGYLVTIGQANYLIDCGASLFQQMGGEALKDISGLIITHCHDDHKRWFTDLAIFYRYAPDINYKINLLASEDVTAELCRMAEPALDRTLSADQKTVIDIPCSAYADFNVLGPRARYRIVSRDEGAGRYCLRIIGADDNIVGPEKAKIVISDKTGRPRMLFRDPEYNEWVEPENFYPYSSDIFYETNKNIHWHPEGFTIEAVKSPVWHGIPNIGIKFSTGKETLVFSSDTVHDKALWKELCTEKRRQDQGMSGKEFEAASVIYGDINNYIERMWSEERYREAMVAFSDAIVIHDISVRDSEVHTGYNKLGNTTLRREKTLLTHSPDTIASEWVLCFPEKRFRIKGEEFFEIVGDKLYPMNADIYFKEDGKYFAGYRNTRGRYSVYKCDGICYILPNEENNTTPDRKLFDIDLYEDISGRYFPRTEDENTVYRQRKDGRVEMVEFTDKGSRGRVVEDCRTMLLDLPLTVSENKISAES